MFGMATALLCCKFKTEEGRTSQAVFTNSPVPLLPVMKEASNVLLVINDSQKDIKSLKEHIANGERRLVTTMIPAASPSSDLVPCGLFIYTKYNIKGISVSAYGSSFGVSFECSGNGFFSVGMDCPNTIAGGNNSIEVHPREHAHDACKMALESGREHGWCEEPSVDVKIGDCYGDVNWGSAIVMR